jgi:hypothetical protein
MKVPEWLRGKAVDDPEVLSWRYGYLLVQACRALDRCFRELGYDDDQIRELLPDDLFEEWEEWREAQEDADDHD